MVDFGNVLENIFWTISTCKPYFETKIHTIYECKFSSLVVFWRTKIQNFLLHDFFFIILMKMSHLSRGNGLRFYLFSGYHLFHLIYLVIMKIFGPHFLSFKGVPLYKKTTFSHNLNKKVSVPLGKCFLKKSQNLNSLFNHFFIFIWINFDFLFELFQSSKWFIPLGKPGWPSCFFFYFSKFSVIFFFSNTYYPLCFSNFLLLKELFFHKKSPKNVSIFTRIFPHF